MSFTKKVHDQVKHPDFGIPEKTIWANGSTLQPKAKDEHSRRRSICKSIQDLQAQHQDNPTSNKNKDIKKARKALVDLNKQIKEDRAAAKDKRHAQQWEEVEQQHTLRDDSSFWHLLEKIDRERHESVVKVITNADGRLCTTKQKVMQVWRAYFSETEKYLPLEAQQAFDAPTTAAVQKTMRRLERMGDYDKHILNAQITKMEVIQALKRAKPFSAPGLDGMRNEMFDHTSVPVINALHFLFKNIWQTKHAPAAWRESSITPIFKDGEKDDPANYRPISLTSCLLRIFERILDRRLRAPSAT